VRGVMVVLGLMVPSGWVSAQGAGAALWEKLERRIGELDRGLDGVLAVVIKDLTDGRTIQLRPNEVMPTASTIKIAVLAELYRQEGQRGRGEEGKRGRERRRALEISTWWTART